jgi:hypothetical protein
MSILGSIGLPELLIILVPIVIIIFIFSIAKKKEQRKNLGIILLVLGGAAGIWVVTRLTSMAGKIHSWEPPFTSYEVTTIIGAVIAIFLIILGIINVTKKIEK